MSWTDPSYQNAWLALDRNHDGSINGVQELFGTPTQPQVGSADGNPNGWLALAIYDTLAYGGNEDGVIDARDRVFADLLLWIDENHNGTSEPQELHHLSEFGVSQIELNYKEHKSYTDAFGNVFRFESYFVVAGKKR